MYFRSFHFRSVKKAFTHQNFLKKNLGGFTLLELLIVVAISSVLSGVGITYYANQRRTKTLETAAQNITGYLRYAQHKSIAQQEGKQWGVHFENPASGRGFYSLYSGSSYSSPIETHYLPAGIEYAEPSKGSSTDISFDKLTGGNYSAAEQEIIIDLTSNQIARVIRTMADGVITSGEGEKGYWKFDEGSGNSAFDNTIYGNTGTLVNGPTWQSSSNCVSGSCLSFDGSDDYVEVPHAKLFHGPDITISFWLYQRAYGSPVAYVTKRTTYSDGLMFFMLSDHHLNFDWGDGSSNYRWDTGYVPPLNQWVYITITRDSSGRRLYANGELKASTSDAGGPIPDGNTAPLRLMADTYELQYFVNGSIDEVRVYNRALSAAEILQHYKAGK